MTDNLFESPRKRHDVVKIKFESNYTYKDSYDKNLRIKIAIGVSIIDKLGWIKGDKIDITGNDKIIMLRKLGIINHNGHIRFYKGHKLSKALRSHCFLLNSGFRYNTDLLGKPINTYPHDIVEDESGKYLMIKLGENN